MERKERSYYLLGARIIGDFGATIAVPVVLLAWLGKTLDARWGTAPWLLVAGFVLAAALSSFSIYRKARHYEKKFQELESRQK